ncbi:hypothetical protein AB0L74_10155 [Streptomyces sp. NPDC052020]|uniref:hypothetical protein n=1 Tax=Streptomyces sp. NPDC052020 TaxID=3155677 RepID=UPI0034189057
MAVQLLKHTLKRNRFGDDMSNWHKCRNCGSNNGSHIAVMPKVWRGMILDGYDLFECNYCGYRGYIGTGK